MSREITVELQVSVTIDNLGVDDSCELSEDQIEIVEEIAHDALPQNVEVYYNGEDNKPAKCFIEVLDVLEVN